MKAFDFFKLLNLAPRTGLMLVLLLFVLTSAPYAQSKLCSEVFKPAPKTQAVNLYKLESDFTQQTFVDHKGDQFKVQTLGENVGKEMDLDYRVIHEKLGVVQVGQAFQKRTTIETNGDIIGGGWIWKVEPELQGRGLISIPFRWIGERMPKGARFQVRDTSDSSFMLLDKMKPKKAEILSALTREGLMAPLWELYRKAYRAQNTSYPKLVETDGFFLYLYDLLAMWGRVMRPVGFRHQLKVIPQQIGHPVLKGKYPQELLQAEQVFLATQGEVALLVIQESITPPKPELLNRSLIKRVFNLIFNKE